MLKIVVFLFIITTQCFNLFSNDKYEIRASWITTIGGLDWPQTKASSPSSIKRQKEELCRQLDFLKYANFNTILFQTRLRGDVIYPSIFETYAESLTGHTGKNPGYDPLRFAIEECHKRGMEIHAWIVCIPIGNNRQVELQGKSSLVKKRPELCKKFGNSWYLDPGNPATANYLSLLVKEIVSNYDIDGIHLDYIRYPENGKDFPDKDTFRKYGRGTDISQWRRNNITHIVRKIYSEVKSLKPWVKVSSSPVGKYNDTSRYSSHGWNAYDAVYQDAQLWLEEGIHDIVFPMMYFKQNQFYPFALDWQENKHGRWVVPGLGIYFLEEKKYKWSSSEILRQMYFIRKNKLDGEAFFRNRFLMKNTEGITSHIKDIFYNKPAVIPPMVWQDGIRPQSPNNGNISVEENRIIMKWDTTGTYKKGGTYFRIYSSINYPVDTEIPENIVSDMVYDNRYIYTTDQNWKRHLYWAVTSVDRYGNESLPLALNKPENGDLFITVNKLPQIPVGGVMIIKDSSGMELIKCHKESEVPQKLNPGIYIIETVGYDGSKRTFTTIIK